MKFIVGEDGIRETIAVGIPGQPVFLYREFAGRFYDIKRNITFEARKDASKKTLLRKAHEAVRDFDEFGEV